MCSQKQTVNGLAEIQFKESTVGIHKYRLASTSSDERPLSSAMSEKFQEFIEVPQQFVRDGRQACLNIFHVVFYKHYLFAVHHALHQAHRKRSAPEMLNYCHVLIYYQQNSFKFARL